MSDDEIRIIKSPWSKAMVAALQKLQTTPEFHGYTCPRRHTLIPTRAGWHCPQCGYQQNWAHDPFPAPPQRPANNGGSK